MQGFDPKFKDFPDYIIGITKEIWEDRGIATLHKYYAKDIVVRMPSGVSTGNQGVIGATMATLAEFPDRTLLGEDVIWSGTPETGMLSSHRILSTATHLGDGGFGAATGKPLGTLTGTISGIRSARSSSSVLRKVTSWLISVSVKFRPAARI